MKKLFSLICAVILGAASSVEVHCAEYCVTERLGIKDSRIREFIEYRLLNNVDKFVITDESQSDFLTDQFDRGNGIYSLSFPEAKRAHADEIDKLLHEDQDVKYNSKILSDWVFCELSDRGVPCQEIEVGCFVPLSIHFAVLIPQVVNGSTSWFVCDVYHMAICRRNNLLNSAELVFYPLQQYINWIGEDFRGMIVIDEDYRCYRDGVSVMEGRDVFCWLSQEGHSAATAVNILGSLRASRLKLMTSEDYSEYDYWLFNFLKKIIRDRREVETIVLC